MERIGKNGQPLETIFDFFLNKTGIETETSYSDYRLCMAAIKGLASNIDLLEEGTMKQLASFLGLKR